MTSTDIIIEIPIQSYLKKYILRNSDQDFLLVSTGTNNHVADFIFNTFTKNFVDVNDRKKKYNYNDKLKLVMPWYLGRERRYHLSHKHVVKIQRFVRSIFHEQLFEYLDDVSQEGGTIKSHMLRQYKKYGFEESDIPLESLLKSYYRYRKDKGNVTTKRN